MSYTSETDLAQNLHRFLNKLKLRVWNNREKIVLSTVRRLVKNITSMKKRYNFHKQFNWLDYQIYCRIFYSFKHNIFVEDRFVPCLHKHLGTGKWIFNATFCMGIRVRARTEPVSILHSKRKHVRSYSLYSTHLTRSEFLVPARGIAYTNITHNVIPLSLCKYTLFSKSEDHLFCNQCTLKQRKPRKYPLPFPDNNSRDNRDSCEHFTVKSRERSSSN